MKIISENVTKWLESLGGKFAEAERLAIAKAVLVVHRRAVKYTPISPTQAQKNRMRKTRRKVKRKAQDFLPKAKRTNTKDYTGIGNIFFASGKKLVANNQCCQYQCIE